IKNPIVLYSMETFKEIDIVIVPNDRSGKKHPFTASDSVGVTSCFCGLLFLISEIVLLVLGENDGVYIFLIANFSLVIVCFCGCGCRFLLCMSKSKEYKIINNTELQEIAILSPVTTNNETNDEITDDQQHNNNIRRQLKTPITNVSQSASDLGVNGTDKRNEGG
ncbi:26859_t:CDS:1, partial [Dentiscutata erythropus]